MMSVGVSGIDTIFFVFFFLIAAAIVGVIAFSIGSMVKEGVNNTNSPKLKVDAKIVNKRENVRGEHTHTYYYVTFEFENNERMELRVTGEQSGLLVEGDQGLLTFQGTKYIEFERRN